MHQRVVKFLTFLSVVLLVGCQRDAGPDARTAAEAAIRAADAATLKAAQTKDVDGVLVNYADDAVWLPPNAPVVQGKPAIRAGWSQFLATPGLSLSWHVEKIEVARSGDMAYTFYKYRMTIQPQAGKAITDQGKDLAVWKKQADSSWKMVADTFNSDMPAATPGEAK